MIGLERLNDLIVYTQSNIHVIDCEECIIDKIKNIKIFKEKNYNKEEVVKVLELILPIHINIVRNEYKLDNEFDFEDYGIEMDIEDISIIIALKKQIKLLKSIIFDLHLDLNTRYCLECLRLRWNILNPNGGVFAKNTKKLFELKNDCYNVLVGL